MHLLVRKVRRSVSVITALCFASIALAGENSINARDALSAEQVRGGSILEGDVNARFEPLNVDPYLQFKENLFEDTGFEYLLYYTAMGHFGTKGDPNYNGQIHTINAWTPFKDGPNAGTAIFYYMHIGQYSSSTAGQLSARLGLTSGINDSGSDVDLFRFVGWYQPIADEKVELYLGQFQLRDIYDAADFASDDTRNFISEIMSGNPSSTLPLPGLGAAVTFNLWESWSVGGGFTDANAKERDVWNFDTFSEDDYAYMGYVNYRPEMEGLGKGNYQLNVYEVDATDNGGNSRGLSLTFTQDVGDRHLAFVKFNRANKRRGETKQSAALALMQKGVHKWEDDLVGIGAGWGDPTDPTRRDEYVLEAFWRMQITPSVQITPDVQLWLKTSRPSSNSDPQAVFSVRGTIDF